MTFARQRCWSIVFVIVQSQACARPVIRGSPDRPVDTLAFVIGDAALWPRRGTQLQNQTVDEARREVCWVKYGDPAKFECWRWDDHWIYHEVDHALDGDATGRSYRFSDGRWLPRHLAGTWTLNLPKNRAIDLTPDCRATERPFPYRLRASLQPSRELGRDLGKRMILTLEYQPYARGEPPRPEALERFSFAEGAGWYLWESAGGTARFDQLGGPFVDHGHFCAAPDRGTGSVSGKHVVGRTVLLRYAGGAEQSAGHR